MWQHVALMMVLDLDFIWPDLYCPELTRVGIFNAIMVSKIVISISVALSLQLVRNINAQDKAFTSEDIRNFRNSSSIQFHPQLSFTSNEFSDKSAYLFARSSSNNVEPWFGQMNFECTENSNPLCSWHIQAGHVSRFVIKNLSRVPFATADPPGM